MPKTNKITKLTFVFLVEITILLIFTVFTSFVIIKNFQEADQVWSNEIKEFGNRVRIETDHYFTEHWLIFITLSQSHCVQEHSFKNCSDYFRRIQKLFPNLVNIAVSDRNGNIFASAKTINPLEPPSIKNQLFFQALSKGKEVYVMDPHVGPISGEYVTGMGMSLKTELGEFNGFLGASMAFDQITELWGKLSKEIKWYRHSMMIIDRDGTIIGSTADFHEFRKQKITQISNYSETIKTQPNQPLLINGYPYRFHIEHSNISEWDIITFAPFYFRIEDYLISQPTILLFTIPIFCLIAITLLLAIKNKNFLERLITAEKTLKISEARYRELFETMTSGVAVCEAIEQGKDFIFREFNRAAEIIENTTREAVIGQRMTDTFPGVKHSVIFEHFQQVWLTGKAENNLVIFYQDERHQGWREVSIYKLPSQELVIVYNDITERKTLEKKLEKQATTDELTGAFNRRHFVELANQEIKRSLQITQPLAIAIIDLDYFKHINDHYGHVAGDKALIFFTQVCRQYIGKKDILARLGGDEFILMFVEATDQEAYQVMEHIRLTLNAQPLNYNQQMITLTISVGIASLTTQMSCLDDLLLQADEALYVSKANGRNCVTLLSDTN